MELKRTEKALQELKGIRPDTATSAKDWPDVFRAFAEDLREELRSRVCDTFSSSASRSSTAEAERIEVGDTFRVRELYGLLCIWADDEWVLAKRTHDTVCPCLFRRRFCIFMYKADLWVGAPVRIKPTGKYGVVTGCSAHGCRCVDESHPPETWHVLFGLGNADLDSRHRHELELVAVKETP